MLRLILETTNLIGIRDEDGRRNNEGEEVEGGDLARTFVLQDPHSGIVIEMPLQTKGMELFAKLCTAEPGEEVKAIMDEILGPQAPQIVIPDFIPPNLSNGDQEA